MSRATRHAPRAPARAGAPRPPARPRGWTGCPRPDAATVASNGPHPRQAPTSHGDRAGRARPGSCAKSPLLPHGRRAGVPGNGPLRAQAGCRRPGSMPATGTRRRGTGIGSCRIWPVPAARPAVPARQPPDHPGLAALVPGNAMRGAPGAHPQVAGEGPGVAGFLVRPQGSQRQRLAQVLQHRLDRAAAQDQRLPECGQRLAQLGQAFAQEVELASAGVGLPPIAGLDHEQRQHRPAPGGLGQWRVVRDPQVALEPDDLDGR